MSSYLKMFFMELQPNYGRHLDIFYIRKPKNALLGFMILKKELSKGEITCSDRHFFGVHVTFKAFLEIQIWFPSCIPGQIFIVTDIVKNLNVRGPRQSAKMTLTEQIRTINTSHWQPGD